MIKRLGDQEQVKNRERFKHEDDGIFAIKGHQVRVYCFMASDRRVVLTNAVEKKRPKARKEELRQAKRIRDECTNR